MVGRDQQQILRLARALRSHQRAQRLGSPGLLAGGLGEAGDHRVPSEEPAGRVPAADLHDAGCRYRGGESGQRMAGVEPVGTAAEMELESLEERDWFRAAAPTTQHWHIDVSYINIAGTFYYLCSVLDGFSRSIVHWDLRESMREADIEIILQAAKEKHPEARPRIISDHGPQFLARDFKEFIRIAGMTHVRTSPYYPQSNGKIERWHKSLKGECIRPGTPLTLEDARRLIQEYVDHYNGVRLHSAIGFVTPADMLAGRQKEIHAARDRKLEEARRQRQLCRQQAA